MKKYIVVITLALFLANASTAAAIDFKAKGLWQFAYSVGDTNLVKTKGGRQTDATDAFHARQRIRLQMDAIASESLSGTVYFEIGMQLWGHAATGAALGADGNVVKIRMAYVDWVVPQTKLKLRMGIQNFNLPRKTGGGMVMDNTDAAGITASYRFSDTIGLTAFWVRPFNDNYAGYTKDAGGGVVNNGDANSLDNMDLFGLTLPLHFQGIELTPWVMYGMRGKNTFTIDQNGKNTTLWKDGMPHYTLSSNPFGGYNFTGNTDKAYGTMFWAGLPLGITGLDPWNIEFDINYGYVEEMGRYDATVRGTQKERASTRREGWLASGLAEYKMDWGIPGIFGWYGSGDDGSLKNGSERMPSINPWSKYTSFMGGANYFPSNYCDIGTSYAGTWGIGAHVRNISFVENLKHILRIAYWRGTNSTGMVKYAASRDAWNYSYGFTPNKAGIYLTTEDALLELNLDNYWQVYDNLRIGLELGYIVNNMSANTWQDSSRNYLGSNIGMQDVWKATLYVGYTF